MTPNRDGGQNQGANPVHHSGMGHAAHELIQGGGIVPYLLQLGRRAPIKDRE